MTSAISAVVPLQNTQDASTLALKEKLENVKTRDEAADKIIKTAIYTNAAMGVVPFGVNWALFVGTSAVMVITLGKTYGYTLNKEQGAELVKQMFMAAGFTYGSLLISSKVLFEVLKVTGIGTVPALAMDGALCGAATYAIGYCAKTYFEKGCKLDKAEMAAIMKARTAEGKTVVSGLKKV
jgi:uncharacterized protein (DUF697 family)